MLTDLLMKQCVSTLNLSNFIVDTKLFKLVIWFGLIEHKKIN